MNRKKSKAANDILAAPKKIKDVPKKTVPAPKKTAPKKTSPKRLVPSMSERITKMMQ